MVIVIGVIVAPALTLTTIVAGRPVVVAGNTGFAIAKEIVDGMFPAVGETVKYGFVPTPLVTIDVVNDPLPARLMVAD